MKVFDPSHFLSRELSWLEFNQRVLNEAANPRNPLLERVKFFTITSSNLDEFFEVRIAGLKQQIESGVSERYSNGSTAPETFKLVRRRIHDLVDEQYHIWRDQLLPELLKAGFHFYYPAELRGTDREWLEDYYRREVRPVVTPLGLDPAHPFPELLNKSLNIVVHLEVERGNETFRRFGVVPVPRLLPRLVELPRDNSHRDFVFMGYLIGTHLADLFPGTRILGYWHFRVTRNGELYIDEEDSGNLLSAVEQELHRRRRGAAVRLEVDANCPPEIYQFLLERLDLHVDDLYRVDGPLNPTRLMAIYESAHVPELRDEPFVGPIVRPLKEAVSVFSVLRHRDILLHHPFESFGSVVDFLMTAAHDPQVLAIKQTLYRTGGDPRIVGALMEAVRNGKQVTAVTELKARFDEANNIQWARKLEEAGVHVVYGIVNHKVHAKIALVVRRDDDGLRRYLHLGTGNYNPSTSKLYTDMSLLTSNPAFGEDATNFFNLLTGISEFPPMQKLLVAPFTLHDSMVQMIRQEGRNAKDGKEARIIAKMNALVDPEIIERLYEASQAGVKIDLIVRGICCLRPGLTGVSENITVRSIVGRFLEHSRIFYFHNDGDSRIYLGSADWMPRNFFRRVETVFPVEDPNIRSRVYETLLCQLRDNVRASILNADGTYERVKQGDDAPFSSQDEFMKQALRDATSKRIADPEDGTILKVAAPPKLVKP